MGVFKFGKFITFIPHSVVVGFVNALAIIIFMAQLPSFAGAHWQMYAMVAGTLVIVYGLPRITKAVPSAADGGAVQITVNGRDLGAPGEPGQAWSDTFTFDVGEGSGEPSPTASP